MSENEKIKENIKREDRKSLKKYIVILIFSMLFGGVLGFCVGFIKGMVNKHGYVDFANTVKYIVINISFYVPAFLTVVFIPVITVIFAKCKRLYSQCNEEDEEQIYAIEQKMQIACTLSDVIIVGALIFLIIGVSFFVSPTPDVSVKRSPFMILALILGYVVLGFLDITLKQKIVNMIKEINPEKRGSVYDINFQDKWLESSDEAQRLDIYMRSYKAYRTTNISCFVMMLVCFSLMLFGWIGIAPVCVIGIIMLVGIITYSTNSRKKVN